MVQNVYPPSTLEKLRREAGLDMLPAISEEDWKFSASRLKDADYVFSTWGMPVLTREEIGEYMTNLKAVFYAAGSVQGFARPFLQNGVRVFSAWAANAVPVAEFAFSQILLANTGYFRCAEYQSRGEIEKAAACKVRYPGNFGCKVGILGAGQIGTLVIRMLKSRNLGVLVFDPYLSEERAEELQVRKASLPEIFTECQTISNHLANKEQTVGILNYRDCFSRMKEAATFINTGRGAQVVEKDLVRALKEKPDACALLDVTFPEPPETGHPFYSMPNVFLTPHIAGSKGDEVKRMSLFMLEEFERLQGGEKPKYEVTETMLEHMA